MSNKIVFKSIKSFSQKLLQIMILLFCFSVAFSDDFSKYVLYNMAIVWLFSVEYKKIYFLLKESRLFLFIFLFVIWVLISILFTEFTNSSFEALLKYFLLPILIISTTFKQENIKYMVSAFLFGMFINELISYGIYFEYIKDSFLGFNITGNKYNPVPFMASHMEYTLFLSLSIALSVFSIFYVKSRLVKLVLIFFIITMTINLFLTTGRTGQFTLLCTLFALLLIYFRHNLKIVFSGFITILFVFIIAFLFSNNTNTRLKQGYSDIYQVITNNNYNSSLGIRLSSYILIPKIIKDENFNTIYGMGYTKVDSIIHQIHLKEFGKKTLFKVQEGHLHNSYITIFAGTGFVGLLLLLYIWYCVFSVKIKDDYLNYVRYSFLFVVFLGGFTENMFRQKEVILLSTIFISIVIISSAMQIGKTIDK